MKKKLLFYGNCHCSSIAEWMFQNYSEEFEILDCEECGLKKFHNTYKNFAVWFDNLESQREYYKCVHKQIKQADYFIFQPIEKSVIEELRTEYLIDNIVTGTSICIPNTRFFSYPVCCISLTPQVKYIYQNITKNENKIIQYLTEENDPKFKEIVFSTYETCITENKRRYSAQANNCSNKIDMCQFIEENWKKHLLFGTYNHPIGVYWKELLTKLFKLIDKELKYETLKVFSYPNNDRILNPQSFSYFKNLFPGIMIPPEINKLVGVKEWESPGFEKPFSLINEPLSMYYE